MSIRQESLSSSRGSINEERWIIHIRDMLEKEIDNNESECRMSIFKVPPPLFVIKPEAFTPQEIAIGPYHHWNPELNEMERFKLFATRRAQRSFPNYKIHEIINQLDEHEHRIRSCYHRYLEYNRITLVWIMALDACFLLEYLQFFALGPTERSLLKPPYSGRSHLINYVGRKAAQQYILRDIMMLENQIPLFVLSFLLEIQLGSSTKSEEGLKTMLHGLCVELSPFKMIRRPPEIHISKSNHLLEALYYSIIPPKEIPPETQETEDHNKRQEVHDTEKQSISKKKSSKRIRKHCATIITCFASINFSGLIRCIQRMKKLIAQCLKLFSPDKALDFSDDDHDDDYDNGDRRDDDGNMKPPLVEEIMIPSVEELARAGVRFCVTTGRLRSIRFDVKTVTLFLPNITLDVNTEVMIRNLVAYEATVAPGALVFSRYIELMNGIIDTEEDVKILREKGIVCNHLKSDTEVACMFNSMSKAVRLTKVEFLDKVIEDVNKYYTSRWGVRMANFMKKSVFGSWKILTFLASIMLLLMTGLETLCSVYSCSHWLGNKAGSRFHQQSKSYPGF